VAVIVTHSKVATLPDEPGAEVNKLEWNDNHVVTGLGTLATQDGTFSGTSSGTNTGDQTLTLTGDVTGTGASSFAATIANSAVTLAKMENRATQTFIGRNTAGAGAPEELSAATAKTILSLNNVTNDAQTKAAIVPNTAPSAGQILAGNAGGTAYAPVTVGTDATLSSAGALTIANNAVTDAKFRQGVARSVVGVTGNATANTADIQGATDTVLRVNGAGTAVAFGAIDLSKVAAATGVIQAASFPALTGDVTTSAGALATTIGATKVTRAMLNNASDGTGGRNWTFLGTSSGTGVTVGPLVWTGSFQQIYFEYIIGGYNGGTPIGRLLCGAASISTTALTNGNGLMSGATLDATSVSKPGCPLAVTASAIARQGRGWISGASGALKQIDIIGKNGNPAVATSPTLFQAASFFSDLGTNLLIQRLQLTVYDTLIATAASAQTFTATTAIWAWGRNND